MPARRLGLIFGVAAVLAASVAAALPVAFRAEGGDGQYEAYVPLVVRTAPDDTPTPLPTPTATRTPSPTPNLPAATPTQAATPSPAGLFIRNFSAYLSSTGTVHVVGEVVNNTTSAAQFVEITGRFYSSSDTLLDTDFTFADVITIPAGGDSPFDLLLFDPLPGIVRYTVQVTDYVSPPYDPPVTGLSAQVTNSFVSSTGTLHDVGTVTNSSSTTYEFVEIIAAYYDATGKVIRTEFTFSAPSTLGPGQSGSFELLLFDGGDLSIASRRIWVDALQP